MRKIAEQIERSQPERKAAFCELLTHENKEVCLWVAHHVLEVMDCDHASRKTALRAIQEKAGSDETANGFGEKLWLKEWYKSHPRDSWI